MYEKTKRSMYAFAVLMMTVSTTVTSAPITKEQFRIKSRSGNGELFLGGVYLYKPTSGDGWSERSLEAHFRWLSQLGINLVHVSDVHVWDPKKDAVANRRRFFELAEKYQLKVIWQMNESYYSGDAYNLKNDIWCTSGCEARADSAVNYLSDPIIKNANILAYSVREEPPHCAIEKEVINDVEVSYQYCGKITPYLMNFYEKIAYQYSAVSGDRDVPFFLLHNELPTAEYIHSNYGGNEFNVPRLTGTDRYFMIRSEGNLHCPNFALSIFNDSPLGIRSFRNATSEPQSFFSVVSGNSQLFREDSNKPFSARQNGTLYYAPKHAMSAQVWLSVANGSNGIMAWSANPVPLPAEPTMQIHEMTGKDGRGHRTLFEYAKAIRELSRFGWVINRTSQPQDASALLANKDPSIVANSMRLEGYANFKLLALVNTKVSPITTRIQASSYAVDEFGNLSELEFPPMTAGLDASLSPGSTYMFDLETGRRYLAGERVTLNPGSGKLLLAGSHSSLSAAEGELGAIRRATGLSTTHFISSDLLARESTLLEHRPIVLPHTPLVSSGSYVMDGLFREREFSLDKRFRLHVKVSGSGLATFQSRAFGFKHGAQVIEANLAIPETAVGSTIKEVVSEDFIVSSAVADTARIYFYHQNMKGELTIHDAWLEEMPQQTTFKDYYYIDYGVSLKPNVSYKVNVQAREGVAEESTIGIRYLAYNSANQLIEVADIPGVPWGTELDKDFKFITNAQSVFKVTKNNAAYVRIAIYRPNFSSQPNNTITLKEAWVAEVLN